MIKKTVSAIADALKKFKENKRQNNENRVLSAMYESGRYDAVIEYMQEKSINPFAGRSSLVSTVLDAVTYAELPDDSGYLSRKDMMNEAAEHITRLDKIVTLASAGSFDAVCAYYPEKKDGYTLSDNEIPATGPEFVAAHPYLSQSTRIKLANVMMKHGVYFKENILDIMAENKNNFTSVIIRNTQTINSVNKGMN